MTEPIAPPFPWFGGKSRASHLVWAALGTDIHHYAEPFAGSLAVCLARPAGLTATVNDIDGYICNFWRATQAAPDEVAAHADWPVNETDLFARHLWLVNEGLNQMKAGLENDPLWYDARIAGWWVWGLCSWIGSGWCSGKGPHRRRPHLQRGQGVNRQRPHLGNDGKGVNRKLPHLGNDGQGVNRQLPHQGVNRQRPHMGNDGQGVKRQLPHLGTDGQGVNRQRPHLGNDGQGVKRKRPNLQSGQGECEARREHLIDYMRQLADRLRGVRVCCGDWKRIVTHGALSLGDRHGVFLDPPYDLELRDKGCYNEDTPGLSAQVREWCLENGDNPRLRIVLAGYAGEHDLPGWRRVSWTGKRAYGRAHGDTANSANRHLETLWLSPHCVGEPREVQMGLY